MHFMGISVKIVQKLETNLLKNSKTQKIVSTLIKPWFKSYAKKKERNLSSRINSKLKLHHLLLPKKETSHHLKSKICQKPLSTYLL